MLSLQLLLVVVVYKVEEEQAEDVYMLLLLLLKFELATAWPVLSWAFFFMGKAGRLFSLSGHLP